MNPIPNPRTLGEVGIYLRSIEEDLTEIKKNQEEIKNAQVTAARRIEEERQQREQERENKRHAIFLIFLSSIISPIIVGLVLIAFKGVN